jgi:hypothetical protein
VCYLTPNAPVSSGTGLYRRKSTGLMTGTKDEQLDIGEPQDKTKWELVDTVGNVFNRLVMYRGDLWHISQEYFGNSKENGRLFQLFFISTEY